MPKIWWQSATPIAELTAYRQLIQEHAERVLPDWEVTVAGIPKAVHLGESYLAMGVATHLTILGNGIKAEREGYDAIAIGSYTDPALDPLREAVNIPVLGIVETSLRFAAMYGRRIGIVTLNERLATKHMGQLVHRYQMTNQVLPPVHFETDSLGLAAALDNPGSAADGFIEACQRAVAMGADIIIPAGGALNALCIRLNLWRVPGAEVPLLDITGLLLKSAETAVRMREISGLLPWRKGTYAPPPAAAKERLMEQIERWWQANGV